MVVQSFRNVGEPFKLQKPKKQRQLSAYWKTAFAFYKLDTIFGFTNQSGGLCSKIRGHVH